MSRLSEVSIVCNGIVHVGCARHEPDLRMFCGHLVPGSL